MKFEFIHTADLHLDSPLEGLSRYEGCPADQIRIASRGAFERLIDEAIERKVAFIVIAGDVVDGPRKEAATGLYFVRQCARATRAGIRIYVLWGNHDAESTFMKKLDLGPGVFTFRSSRPETHTIDELKVALHGQSFAAKAVMDNLAVNYPSAVPGYTNIGVLHTCLTGSDDKHLPYAPCTIPELIAKDYDYWALGHVHTYARVCENPPIIFPGNLQGRSVRETGPRGAMICTVDDGRVTAERLLFDVMQWQHIALDISAAQRMEDVTQLASKAFAGAIADAGKLVAIRLTLTGRTSLHGRLFAEEAQVRGHLLAAAVALDADRCWLEKLRIATEPTRSAEEMAESGDALSALQALLASAADDPELRRDFEDAFGELRNKVKPEVLDGTESADLVRGSDWAELLKTATPRLIDRLAQGN
jgi:exonuclease SbcD